MAEREGWNTRVGLVLAMAGNAVGLGNFLRFPAQAAQNGGGAFLIPYLVSFLLMGLPILWVEWALGRHGGRFGHHSLPGLFQALGRQRWLKYLGSVGLVVPLTIVAYYCYIESWSLAYVWHSLIGTFRDTPPTEFFSTYLGQDRGTLAVFPVQAVIFYLVTLGLNAWVLSMGVARGIERVARIAMPMLLIFGVVLAVRGLTLGSGDPGVVESPLKGLNFVWEPQLSGLGNPSVWLAAAGQVFFTLSVGVGSVACYAAYVGKDQDIALNAAAAGWLNEFVEVVLGSSILIPIATAYLGLAAVASQVGTASGFDLAFVTLPTLFANWGWLAPVAGVMWFGLLFFAGVTSSLALGQPVLAFLTDLFGFTRRRAALFFLGSALALGLICIIFFPGGAFAEFDFWTGTFGLVAFALVEALLFTLLWGVDRGWEELTRGAELEIPRIFRFVVRFVTPAFILLVFVGATVRPLGDDWRGALASLLSGGGWRFHPESLVGKVLHLGEDYVWFTADGRATSILVQDLVRIVLCLVLALCLFLIWLGWRRRKESGS